MYFKYIIDETFISLKKSPMMLFCAVVIITTSLALLGVFIMGDKFFKAIVSNFENNLEIVAFLEDGFNESTVKNVIIPSISTYQGVSSVRLVTKEGAREELKKEVPELNEVFSVIEENPLPASIRVKVTSADSLAEITAKLKKENGIAVSEVTYGGESVNSFLNAAKSLKQFMVLFLLLFILTSIVVTSATIKLTVYSRRDDIEIMKLVGATDWYVKWPYLIEGIILGVASGALATLLILFFKNSAVLELSKSMYILNAVKSDVSMMEICWKLILVGTLQGVIGAMWSTASVLSEKF